MKLIYENKTIDIIDCITFIQRLKGFMFQKNINNALLFKKCNSVHTFFMKTNIDIIMCNNNNEILFFYKDVKPNKIILPKKGVSKVIETPANFFNIKLNSKIILK